MTKIFDGGRCKDNAELTAIVRLCPSIQVYYKHKTSKHWGSRNSNYTAKTYDKPTKVLMPFLHDHYYAIGEKPDDT